MARTFDLIHKDLLGGPVPEPNPPAIFPVTYPTPIPNPSARARTYSQVIAEATRGVDGGMNKPPRPADASSPTGTADDLPLPDFHGHYSVTAKIEETDDAQNLVFGWASITDENGQEIEDSQGDLISEDDLEKAFYDWAEHHRKGGEMHRRTDAGHMVECMVFTREKQKALGIDLGKVGAWIGMRVDDATFAKVKAGEYRAFSIGGLGRRVTE